jgi:hypothetical protein
MAAIRTRQLNGLMRGENSHASGLHMGLQQIGDQLLPGSIQI